MAAAYFCKALRLNTITFTGSHTYRVPIRVQREGFEKTFDAFSMPHSCFYFVRYTGTEDNTEAADYCKAVRLHTITFTGSDILNKGSKISFYMSVHCIQPPSFMLVSK